jgi:uncharacterized protein
VEFEWYRRKAALNAKKHGVSFTEAATIFSDPFELTIPDPDHSEIEARFLSVGISSTNRIIVVAYTEREERIRIISAREAAPKEIREYATSETKRR